MAFELVGSSLCRRSLFENGCQTTGDCESGNRLGSQQAFRSRTLRRGASGYDAGES